MSTCHRDLSGLKKARATIMLFVFLAAGLGLFVESSRANLSPNLVAALDKPAKADAAKTNIGAGGPAKGWQAKQKNDDIISVKKLFLAGGWAMWPLLLLSVVLVMVVLERFYFFGFVRVSEKGYKQKLIGKIETNGLNSLDEMNGHLALTSILKEGLRVGGRNADIFSRTTEREAGDLLVRSERGLPVLAAISTIGPLIGFLGTVSGMIGAFDAIATADTVNAKVVAGGIKEALITTATGLIVGIPAMGFFQFFSGRVNHYASEIEGAANTIYKELLRGQAMGSPGNLNENSPSPAPGQPVLVGESAKAVGPDHG